MHDKSSWLEEYKQMSYEISFMTSLSRSLRFNYTRVKFEIISDVTSSRGKPVQFWPRQISVYVEPQ